MLLEQEGFKVAMLRASVDASRREDWIAEQLDRGIDVLITNPELVKTGLDLLDFPTIVFMQSGYNVYSLQQAARRSAHRAEAARARDLPRLRRFLADDLHGADGQEDHGLAVHLGRRARIGARCPEPDGDSVEVALARQLVTA